MSSLHDLAWFFGGAFLVNAIPHLASGTMGRAFQSPFAKPRGIGLSSSTVNVIWGFVNLVIGYLLVVHVGDFDMHATVDVAIVGCGGLLIALYLARHFGSLHGGNAPLQS
jgi:hypothetical protein